MCNNDTCISFTLDLQHNTVCEKVKASEDQTHLGVHMAAGALEEPEFPNIKNRNTQSS